MHFEKERIFHVYNQGNNRNKIFFKKRNYIFFLGKMREHVLPYADFLAWCLMPNHFHWMIYVKETELEVPERLLVNKQAKFGISNQGIQTIPNNQRVSKSISLNHSIGTLLASYTRAINIQEDFTGSLFRKKTNANCVNDNSQTLHAWVESLGITTIIRDIPEIQYPRICFDYIHQNPVKAGFVKKPEEWEFSSYSDIFASRKGTLVNRERIIELGLMEGPGWEDSGSNS